MYECSLLFGHDATLCAKASHIITGLQRRYFTRSREHGRKWGLHETAEIEKVVDELEELANVVRDGG